MRPLANIGLIALALALAGAGCVSGNSPVLVTGFFELSPSSTGCAVGSTELANGLLDSNQGTGYMVGISLINQLGQNASASRTATNYAYLDSLHATYRTDGSIGPPPAQTIAASGVVAPGGTLSLPVTLLTSQNGQSLAGQAGGLIVDLTISGHFEDGSTFTTAKESFPITVCNSGCGVPTCEKVTASCGPDAAGQLDGRTCG